MWREMEGAMTRMTRLRATAVAALTALAFAGPAAAQNDADARTPSARQIADAVIATEPERIGETALALAAAPDAPLARRLTALEVFLAFHPDASATLFAALAAGADPASAAPQSARRACRAEALAAAIVGKEGAALCPPPALPIATLEPELLAAALEAAAPSGARRDASVAEIRRVVAEALARFAADAAADAAVYGGFLTRAGEAGADEAMARIGDLTVEEQVDEARLALLVDALAASSARATADALVEWFAAVRDGDAAPAVLTRQRLAARGLALLDPAAPFDDADRRAWLAALLDAPDAAGPPLGAEMLAPLLRPTAPEAVEEWGTLFEPRLQGATPARRDAMFRAWVAAVERESSVGGLAPVADAIVAAALDDPTPALSGDRVERAALAELAPYLSTTMAAALADRTVEDAALAATLDRGATLLWRAVLDRALADQKSGLADALGAQLFALAEDPVAALNRGLGVQAPSGSAATAATAALGALGDRVADGAPAGPAFAFAGRVIDRLGDPSDFEARNAVAAANLHLLDAVAASGPASEQFASTLEPYLAWRGAVADAAPCDGAGALRGDAAASCRLPLGAGASLILSADADAAFSYMLIDAVDDRVLAAGVCAAGDACVSGGARSASGEAILLLETAGAPITVAFRPIEPVILAPNAPRADYGDGRALLLDVDYAVEAAVEGEVWLDLPSDLGDVVFIETVDLIDAPDGFGSVDPIIGVYQPGAGQPLFSDDDGGEGFASRLGFQPQPGQSYQLYVGNIGAAGTFTLRVRRPVDGRSLPPLESFGASATARVDAALIELGVDYVVEADAGGAAWYQLPPIEGRGLRIETFDLIGVDTVLDVYASGSNTIVLSDDDGGGGLASLALVLGEPGDLFELQVRNIGGSGRFGLRATPALEGELGPRLTQSPSLPPADIAFGDRLAIVVDDGETSAWLAFEAASNAPILLETFDLVRVDTVLEIWTEGGDRLLVTDDDGGVGLASRLQFTPEAGEVYWVKARNISYQSGAFILTLSEAPAP